MEAAAGIHYLAPIPEGEKIENPTRGCKQGKSNVTFVDTAKTAQSFAFIHASVFIIKAFGVPKHQEQVTIEVVEEV